MPLGTPRRTRTDAQPVTRTGRSGRDPSLLDPAELLKIAVDHFPDMRIIATVQKPGPVTAGIIGTHKFAYDLWGDTVNTASRMESSGLPGKIQLAPSTHELIQERYTCESRGSVQIKGKAPMTTYLLMGRR